MPVPKVWKLIECTTYSLRNIKAIKTVILKILKTQMAKGTKLSEFQKGGITSLKVGKSQKEISKALGRSKFAITRKVQISMKQEKRLIGQKNYHHNSREELFAK